MSKLFWIAAALCLAIIFHAALILVAPSYGYGGRFDRIAALQGRNTFFILPESYQARLFPAYSAASVIGVCAFDVSENPVSLTAQLPQGYWILTVYSSRGAAIYSVNDRQAASNSVTLSLSRAPGLIETLQNATTKEAVEENAGWTVKSVDPKGLAVVWFPNAEAGARRQIADIIGKSTCSTAP